MLQIVLHLFAHQLNILEQVVEIKEQDRSKAFEELQQHMASDLDLSSIKKSESEKHVESARREPSDITLTVDDSKNDRKEKLKRKMEPKKGKYFDERSTLDESEDDQKQKTKMKLKSKKERAADEVSTTFDLESDVESKIGKTDREELKSKRIKLLDDASSLGGSKHSEEGKTKKEEIYDDDDETLTSEDSDQTKQKKEVKDKDKMATRTEKRRKTDDTYDSYESENYKQRADKKSGDEMVKKSKTGRSDKSSSSYESKEDEKKADTKTKDKKVKSKTSKADDDVQSKDSRIQKSKGKMKSRRSKISKDSVTSDESDEDKTMLDKKNKERLEIKTKEGKTAHSTRSHSGNQLAESKSGSQSRQTSVELATRSQFELLVPYVKKLLQQTGPVPMPTMPDNKKLKDDLVKGSASLPVTMEAMQINARVKAAEEALTRMADLLNQLAAVGVFPPETLNLITQLQQEHDEISSIFYGSDDEEELRTPTDLQQKPTDVKSVGTDARSIGKSSKVGRPLQGVGKPDDVLQLSRASTFTRQAQARTPDALVTRADMIEALRQLREDMFKHITALTDKATTAVQKASTMARAVADRLETAISVDKRIDNLDSLTSDYADQLSGFDFGLHTQLQNLQEQMAQMDAELKEGLAVFDMSDKMESNGIIELRRSYDNMMAEVHQIIHKHKNFVAMEETFTEDLKKSEQVVEWLIEQKADWDEVADGLRDKVDISRLQGVPDGCAFETTRFELTKQILSCYGKFKKQKNVWSIALSDLRELVARKANVSDLLEFEKLTKSSLKKVRQQLHELEVALGMPKAAIVIRHIMRDGVAGPSTVPVLVEPSEKHYSRPTPSPASSIHKEPVEEEPCSATVRISGPPEIREHICKRWVGGSHTLVTEHTTHENVAPSLQQKMPTRQYTGIGVDGHPYVLEEELQPCIECNEILSQMYQELPLDQAGPVVFEVGGGDQNLVDDNQDKKV